MWRAILRHFTSRGFKDRVVYIYYPAIKVFLAYFYNIALDARLKRQKRKEFAQRRNSEVHEETNIRYEEVPAGAPVQSAVLTYEQAVKELKRFLIDHKPQYLGTCVGHTTANIHSMAVKVRYGIPVRYSADDIYMDRDTKSTGIDQGMYPDRALNRVAQKGVALYGAVPEAKTIDDLVKNTRAKYPDNSLEPVRDKAIKSHKTYNIDRNFDLLWTIATNIYATQGMRPMQVSIRSYQGMFNGDLPTATGNIYGGHSKIMLSIPFMFNGKRALFSIDSAYNRGRVWRIAPGVRIEVGDNINNALSSMRTVDFITEYEKAFMATRNIDDTTPDVPVDPTAEIKPTRRMKWNSTNASANYDDNVANLQRKLIKLGFGGYMPALQSGGAFGFYGSQTSRAVKAWKEAQYGMKVDQSQADNFYPYDCAVINSL